VKVKELIQKLKIYNQDYNVYFNSKELDKKENKRIDFDPVEFEAVEGDDSLYITIEE
jgi:hypothetical protein